MIYKCAVSNRSAKMTYWQNDHDLSPIRSQHYTISIMPRNSIMFTLHWVRMRVCRSCSTFKNTYHIGDVFLDHVPSHTCFVTLVISTTLIQYFWWLYPDTNVDIPGHEKCNKGYCTFKMLPTFDDEHWLLRYVYSPWIGYWRKICYI